MAGREKRNLHLTPTKVVDDKRHTVDMHNQQPLLGKRISFSQLPNDMVSRIKQNLSSGLIVALVNLPLSISLAVAAKSTPQAGVISAIVSGFICGIFGGSDFNIIGPTGALSGFLATAVEYYQSEEYAGYGDILPVFAVFTGIFTFLILILRLQKYVELFPSSVNEGFTLGVAVIIFTGQLNNAFGLEKLPRHEHLPLNVYETFSHIQSLNSLAFFICTLFLAIFFIFVKIAPKIPWQAVLSFTGIIIGATIADAEGYTLSTLYDKYGDLGFEGHLFIKDIRLESITTAGFYVTLLPITFVAILETLISAKIADKMTNTKFSQVGEMVALGLSNVLSGVFGGLPSTAALARTALNIKSGGTHKMSSFINAIVMVLVSIFLFTYFKYLPLAVVAAQVMIVAIRMVDYHSLEFYWKADKEQFWIMITVGVVSILIDTTYGLIIGMFIYLFTFAEKMMEAFSEISVATTDSSVVYHIHPDKLKKKKKMIDRGLFKWSNPDKMVIETSKMLVNDLPVDLQGTQSFILYRFIGVINFMNISQHEQKIKLLPEVDNIFLSLRFVYLLDLESLGALKLIIEKLEENGKSIFLCGISEDNLFEFGKYNKAWLETLVDHGKIWELRDFAQHKILPDETNYSILAQGYT